MTMRRTFSRWPLPHWQGRHAHEPGAALFQGIRVRLTFWYCGVLSAALVLFGVALYFGTQYSLLNPITANAQFHAQGHMSQWLRGSPAVCTSFGPTVQPGPPGPCRTHGF